MHPAVYLAAPSWGPLGSWGQGASLPWDLVPSMCLGVWPLHEKWGSWEPQDRGKGEPASCNGGTEALVDKL